MTISDALPVQLWLNGVETFNERIEAGIEPDRCFCQPWLSSDKIYLQVTDATIYADGKAIILVVVVDGVITDVFDFSTSYSSIFSLVFNIGSSSFDYNNTLAKLYLMPGPSTWENFGSGTSWSATPAVILPGPGQLSKKYRHACSGIAGDVVHIVYNITTNKTTGSYGVDWFIVLLDEDGAQTESIVDIYRTSNGSEGDTIDFVATQPFSYIAISATTDDIFVSGNVTVTVNTLTIDGLTEVGSEFNEEAIENMTLFYYAKSDCLDIRDTQYETQLVQYSNRTNYSGLDYRDSTLFQFRFRTKFFEERFPPENESEGLSDGEIVKLSSTIKSQKLLEIENAPPYIHKKLILILNHNTVYMDSNYWTMEENYEQTKLNDRFPFFLGKVWLTLKNSNFWTNIFGTERVIS